MSRLASLGLVLACALAGCTSAPPRNPGPPPDWAALQPWQDTDAGLRVRWLLSNDAGDAPGGHGLALSVQNPGPSPHSLEQTGDPAFNGRELELTLDGNPLPVWPTDVSGSQVVHTVELAAGEELVVGPVLLTATPTEGAHTLAGRLVLHPGSGPLTITLPDTAVFVVHGELRAPPN